MIVTDEYVRVMAAAQGLVLPEDEVANVRRRLVTWMEAMQQIEEELGSQMNAVDPIPPVSAS